MNFSYSIYSLTYSISIHIWETSFLFHLFEINEDEKWPCTSGNWELIWYRFVLWNWNASSSFRHIARYTFKNIYVYIFIYMLENVYLILWGIRHFQNSDSHIGYVIPIDIWEKFTLYISFSDKNDFFNIWNK